MTDTTELTELRITANELRGCGATVQQIAAALKVSQSEALALLARRPDG